MKRTLIKNLGENIRKEVLVKGWVDIRRDHGKLIFIDLRDFSGLVQAVSTPKEDSHKVAETIRPEWVVEVKGMVNERPENMVNADIQNGNIELKITEIKVLNEAQTPPIDIQSDGKDIGEENRLKYRYLDLRRKRMQKNLRNRSKALTFIRNYLEKEDFTEVETPILSKSTPEGARDFIVPSRIDKGKFYALPQSPQQYKQLLVVAGMERYFQIARCFRDEDSRGDRQPEFTQLDIEMSFVDEEDIMTMMEGLMCQLFVEAIAVELPQPVTRLPRHAGNPRLVVEVIASVAAAEAQPLGSFYCLVPTKESHKIRRRDVVLHTRLDLPALLRFPGPHHTGRGRGVCRSGIHIEGQILGRRKHQAGHRAESAVVTDRGGHRVIVTDPVEAPSQEGVEGL